MEAFHRRDRAVAWGLTWIAYASYYLGRKGFSVAKKSLHDKLGISEATLGAIDTLYLSSYALGLFASGYLGDRIGARRLVGYGLLFSAACCAGFGSANSAAMFGAAFLLNGFAQSTGWPGTTRCMAEWTTRANRGTVMAFWATCYQVGGIAASFAAGYALKNHGWRWAFFAPACWLAALAVVVLAALKRGPSEDLEAGVDGALPPASLQPPPPTVLRNPILWCYGASYFFIKFIRYALLFWLPYYLAQRRGMPEHVAAYVSTAFEVGGIVGVIVIGTASDRLRRLPRATLAAVSLVMLALALLGYAVLDTASVTGSVIALGLIGASLFGPDSLISGAAAQDAGGPRAASMATGFVNGVGSIGAILEGICVPWISRVFGWHAVFPIFVGMAVVAAVCLLPTLWLSRGARAT